MERSRSGLVRAGLAFVLLFGAGRAHAAGLHWPETELSRHAQAWFAMLQGDEAAARTFLTAHMAPSALEEAPVEERLQRRSAMLERTQGLTPLEVVESGPAALSVHCKAGNGDDMVAVFEAEAGPPHRILGVRLQATPGDAAGAHRPPGPGAPGAGDRVPDRPGAGASAPLNDFETLLRMRALLDSHAKAGDFSGVALLVRGDSTLMSGAWGLADRDHATPVTLGTRFNIASIGKLFTRTAIAQLAEQGRLSLDDTLSRYLPGFPHADSITLDMLCRHRSGVGDFFNGAYQDMDRSQLRHNHDYLALLRDQPLWFAPGTRERYSNGGYVLLGEVIAKASGEDYYDYLARHLYAPAGMQDTGAPIEGDGTPALARGYTRQGVGSGDEQDNVITRPARGSAAGGSYSTAADLVAFEKALLAGRLCSKPWADWVTGGPRPDRSRAAPDAPAGYGFAGGAPGIAGEWMHEGDLTLVVLTNRDAETTKQVMAPLRQLFRRMKTTPRRGTP